MFEEAKDKGSAEAAITIGVGIGLFDGPAPGLMDIIGGIAAGWLLANATTNAGPPFVVVYNASSLPLKGIWRRWISCA